MKLLLVISMFYLNNCFSQDVELQMLKKPGDDTKDNMYVLKLFNNQNVSIGIKCSIGFPKFSEQDTLQVAIGDWYNGNGRDYFYGIEQSVKESKYSESFPYYQLIIVNPQTYFITHVDLTDIEKHKNKNVRFSIIYTTELTCEEVKKFTTKSNIVQMIKDEKTFSSKTVELKTSPVAKTQSK